MQLVDLMDFDHVIIVVSRVIEGAGVAAMVVGFVIALAMALQDLRTRGGEVTYRQLRERIGRAILLGLELLVAADILRTVSEMPSLEQVGVLAAIVAIRTFLSFTLEIELSGRLPWRSADAPS